MKPFNSFVEWAKANAHPVSSASEDNAEELSFLKFALADARVVSLGEFQHYTGVFNAFHFKLFRYLVENLGFTAFAFETPFADAALAYRYVVGEDIPEDKVFCYGMSPMFGGWKETQDLLRWMREYNLSNKGEKPLHFYGVDIGSAAYGGNSAYPAVKAALDYLAAVDPGYSHGFAWLLETAETQDLFGFKALNPESQKRFLWEATRLYNRISYMGPHDAALTSAEAYQWALRSAYLAVFSARWFAGYAEAGCEDLSDNIRELCMAENINWALEREGPGARLVYHSHNQHISRERRMGGYLQTGVFLDSLLPKGMVKAVAGMGRYSMRPGEEPIPDSIPYALAQVEAPNYLLDLRQCKDPDALQWLNSSHPDRTNANYTASNIFQGYDLVFFTKEPLRLATMCYRPFGNKDFQAEPSFMKKCAGIYRLERTWLPTPVEDYITVEWKQGGLFTHGLYGPNGKIYSNSTTAEHFPVYESRLLPLGGARFYWENYFGFVEFQPDPNGEVNRLVFHYYYFGGDEISAARVFPAP